MINFTSAIPFVGSLWNHFLQSSQQSRSEDFAREMFGRQRDANTQMAQMMIGAQRWNMKNQASLNRSGMVQAGLNPNNPNGLFTTGGISPSTPSTSPTSATYNPPDTSGFSEFGKLVQNEPLVKAEARKLNADAEAQELLNLGKREANEVYGTGQVTPRAFVNPDKPYLVEFELINSKRKPISTKEGFDAVKDITKWYKQDLQEIDAAGVSAELRQLVSQYQIDSDIWQSIAELPDANISYILSMKSVQDALENVHIYDGKIKQFSYEELLPIEKELINLQKTEQEEFKLGPLLAEMKKEFGDGNYMKAFGSLIQMLFVSIIQNVKGSVSAGISHITK